MTAYSAYSALSKLQIWTKYVHELIGTNFDSRPGVPIGVVRTPGNICLQINCGQ